MVLGHTLRVGREMALVVTDDQAADQGVHPLSHTTCGPGLRLLSMLGLTIYVLHVCCTQALFGALVRLIVSLVRSACSTERQNPHVSEKRVPTACSLQLRTNVPLYSDHPSPSC